MNVWIFCEKIAPWKTRLTPSSNAILAFSKKGGQCWPKYGNSVNTSELQEHTLLFVLTGTNVNFNQMTQKLSHKTKIINRVLKGR